ncbi:hypothetical protein EZV62_027429 [Acer yangbiense]|uniref:GDPGP1-like N-terminal domain-containing protein n=1 Tax=Acer yangbiense TaxID=1000413 RepID=A0A5C7GUB7_9ROSI|nr:hypothetical protein EZV62_027429 [Acer yangbiense]
MELLLKSLSVYNILVISSDMQIRADCFRFPDSFGIRIATLPHLERNYNFAFIETVQILISFSLDMNTESKNLDREGEQMWKDHFRYDLTTSEIKVISGRVKFLTQLNEGWNMDYLSKAEDNKACQQIDPFIFYCKNHDEELLFRVASCEN